MRTTLLLFSLLLSSICYAQKSETIITRDIDNFWVAYDQITTSKTSKEKYEILEHSFISKGTPGLKAIMAARGYTSKSYIDAIEKYPLYWKSIRKPMFKAKRYSKEISTNVAKLKLLYPSLKPAKLYFTVGAFRSGGTTMDSLVLIGSEIAMADKTVNTKEFEISNPGLAKHLKTNPVHSLVFTNVHEYIHTQQKTTIAPNLLGQCILEGVAEFLAEKATGQSSGLPALKIGSINKDRVEEVFESVMFNSSNGFWLYSDLANEFNVRDLGYYVGYAICESYYNKSPNKAEAIKAMIEIDYNNQEDLIDFADRSGYFKNSVSELAKKYEESRPTVMTIEQIIDHKVTSSLVKKVTIKFSEAMDTTRRNFELGPLGKENLLAIKKILGFSADGKSLSFEVGLENNKHYQLVVGPGFQNKNGVSLKPYLIDFETKFN